MYANLVELRARFWPSRQGASRLLFATFAFFPGLPFSAAPANAQVAAQRVTAQDAQQKTTSADPQDEVPQELDGLPLLFSADFEGLGLEHVQELFQFTDKAAWRSETPENENAHGTVLSQFKQSDYKPPHRSPFNRAMINDLNVTDFVLTARVRSTIPDYGHRDACLFFGSQDEARLYYVHFGKKTDPNANQVFIVKDAPRTKISIKTTDGTPWDDAWHNVKLVRSTSSGKIAVYFDNMQEPVMTAEDKSFLYGAVGFGSFDDTTQWDDVRVYGTRYESVVKPAADGGVPDPDGPKRGFSQQTPLSAKKRATHKGWLGK